MEESLQQSVPKQTTEDHHPVAGNPSGMFYTCVLPEYEEKENKKERACEEEREEQLIKSKGPKTAIKAPLLPSSSGMDTKAQ